MAVRAVLGAGWHQWHLARTLGTGCEQLFGSGAMRDVPEQWAISALPWASDFWVILLLLVAHSSQQWFLERCFPLSL